MKNLLIILAITLGLSCCKNDDDTPKNPIDQLPPPTQTGENTFGFLINGQPISITNSSQMAAIYQGGFIQFGSGGVYIVLDEPFEINNNYNLVGKVRYVEDNGQESCYYDFNDSYEGFVNFSRIDKTNFIVSGSFEFSTVTDNCEIVNITNGRFDMQYIP
ncbi:hypothetical protein [Mariniflexile sp.]|uniref:hypothetical protein n=1 Tax=Mariniflexile sp. TaxID=1979402 RepID=UPI0035665E30